MTDSPFLKFSQQKAAAKQRGIPFLMSFAQWWRIWERSGHWEQRGVGAGKYVMARKGDVGPYAPSNVKITLCELNARELRHNAATRAKISAAFRGRVFSPEHRAKLAAAHRGLSHSAETRAKISATQRTRERLAAASIASRRQHEQRRQAVLEYINSLGPT